MKTEGNAIFPMWLCWLWMYTNRSTPALLQDGHVPRVVSVVFRPVDPNLWCSISPSFDLRNENRCIYDQEHPGTKPSRVTQEHLDL